MCWPGRIHFLVYQTYYRYKQTTVFKDNHHLVGNLKLCLIYYPSLVEVPAMNEMIHDPSRN